MFCLVQLQEAWSKFDRTNRELLQKVSRIIRMEYSILWNNTSNMRIILQYTTIEKRQISSLNDQLQRFIGQAAKDKESMMARIISLEEQLQQASGRRTATNRGSAVIDVMVPTRKPTPPDISQEEQRQKAIGGQTANNRRSVVSDVFINTQKPTQPVQPPMKSLAVKTPRILPKPHNLETKTSADLPLTPEQIVAAFDESNFMDQFSFVKKSSKAGFSVDDESDNDDKSDHESGGNNKSDDDRASKSSSDEKEEAENSSKEDDEEEDESYSNQEKDNSDDHILVADSHDTDVGNLSKSDVTP